MSIKTCEVTFHEGRRQPFTLRCGREIILFAATLEDIAAAVRRGSYRWDGIVRSIQ